MEPREFQNRIIGAAADATSVFLSGKGGSKTLSELLEANIQKAVSSPVIENTDASDPALEHSLQSRAQNLWANAYVDGGLLNSLFYRQRTPTDVAPYGFFSRDIQLRQLFVLQGNDLIQSAVTTTTQKVQSTEWIIEGPKRTANQYTDMLKQSDLGNGWETFLAKSIQDYQTTDNGMFWELIWSDADRADYINKLPSGKAQLLGLAHMDANRCRRTGDPEFPVLYQSLTGIMHRMHRSRVMFAADMPSPNERLLGRGYCALSRALSVAAATVRYNTYRNELLDDIPPLGLLILSGINKAFWEQNKSEFNSSRQANEQFVFSNLMTLFSMDPTKPASATMVPFKSLWDNFNEKEFWDGAIDIVAMAFGLDRQELAPINASSLGTGAQSSVLAAKARGKGFGNILSVFERKINLLLPESCTFRFDFHDDEADYQQAQLRNQRVGTIISLYTASSGNSKTTPTETLKPLAGDSLRAKQLPLPIDEKPTGDQPTDSGGNKPPENNFGNNPGGFGAPPPPQNKETLVSWDEARQLLIHDIPEWADILKVSPDEDDAMYSDSQADPLLDPDENEQAESEPTTPTEAKALDRYGPVVQVSSTGKEKRPYHHKKGHKRQQHVVPSHLKLTSTEIESAKAYLKSLGIDI